MSALVSRRPLPRGPGAITRSERARLYRKRTDAQKADEDRLFEARRLAPLSHGAQAAYNAARPEPPLGLGADGRHAQREKRKIRNARKRRRGYA